MPSNKKLKELVMGNKMIMLRILTTGRIIMESKGRGQSNGITNRMISLTELRFIR